MPSRRERAIERFCRERGVPRFIPTPTELALLEALEAELAADLESEETVDRVGIEYLLRMPVGSSIDKEPLRAALKAALEER